MLRCIGLIGLRPLYAYCVYGTGGRRGTPTVDSGRALFPAEFMKRRTFIVAAGASFATRAFAQTPHTHHHGFGDADKWAKVFDDPERDAWQKTHEVIQALALKPDAIVADIGAGTGYFAVRLAHMTPKGRVYAVDSEPAMVR